MPAKERMMTVNAGEPDRGELGRLLDVYFTDFAMQ